MHQIPFRLGELTEFPPDPLAGFKGPSSKGRGGEGNGATSKGREGSGGGGR